MSKQVSLLKISSILQKMKIRQNRYTPFLHESLQYKPSQFQTKTRVQSCALEALICNRQLTFAFGWLEKCLFSFAILLTRIYNTLFTLFALLTTQYYYYNGLFSFGIHKMRKKRKKGRTTLTIICTLGTLRYYIQQQNKGYKNACNFWATYFWTI